MRRLWATSGILLGLMRRFRIRLTPVRMRARRAVMQTGDELNLSKQALLVVDVQPSFHVPDAIVAGITELTRKVPTIATVERHNEAVTPFLGQLGWTPSANDKCWCLLTGSLSSTAIFRLRPPLTI